jgi:hypothetical protein
MIGVAAMVAVLIPVHPTGEKAGRWEDESLLPRAKV